MARRERLDFSAGSYRGDLPKQFSGASVTLDRIEQEECSKLLKEIIFLERELESAKIELTLKPDFNLLDAFRMIDF